VADRCFSEAVRLHGTLRGHQNDFAKLYGTALNVVVNCLLAVKADRRLGDAYVLAADTLTLLALQALDRGHWRRAQAYLSIASSALSERANGNYFTRNVGPREQVTSAIQEIAARNLLSLQPSAITFSSLPASDFEAYVREAEPGAEIRLHRALLEFGMYFISGEYKLGHVLPLLEVSKFETEWDDEEREVIADQIGEPEGSRLAAVLTAGRDVTNDDLPPALVKGLAVLGLAAVANRRNARSDPCGAADSAWKAILMEPMMAAPWFSLAEAHVHHGDLVSALKLLRHTRSLCRYEGNEALCERTDDLMKQLSAGG
jgi:hypothetical protein